MMKCKFSAFAALLSALICLGSCADETSEIGAAISKDEVSIIVDSLATRLKAESKQYDYIDSRSTTKLIGRLSVPEYGSLKASFVSQLLCATNMDVPDSIPVEYVDSMKLFFRVPRGSLTGDSLAPQRLNVYRLTKQLPSDINNLFNPEGYYDPKPLGSSSYCLSAIAESDSAFTNNKFIFIPVTLPKELAVESFKAYRNNDPMFAWPSEFAKKFPGIYVEQSFGRGCLANISHFITFTYYHHTEDRTQYVDSALQTVPVLVKDSIALFTSAPEVLSSNNLRYEVSDHIKNLVAKGKKVLTTPGGYYVNFTFPANEIIESYRNNNHNMAVISDLKFQIPASKIPNDYGLGVAPYLLMIKENKIDDFFRESQVPDKKNSFWAKYDEEKGRYDFASMREYLMDLLNSGKTVEPEDMEFTLIPVTVQSEDVTNQYTSVVTTYVLKCSPYIESPTMTVLDTDNAIISFVYSEQVIN